MADDGRRMTDAEFRRLSAKIKTVYQEAYEDIYKKNLEFVKRHERKEAQYRQMVDEGKITKEDFDAWMRGQVFQGKQWEAKRKQMEATMLHADEMAMDMINGSRLRVFADNANYIGYEIEQHGKIQTSFGLYDINSVKRLLMEEPDLLPPRKVGKDASYQWYNKQIQGAVTQGIIQGEPLTDIAKRIGQTTGERCMNAMLRNARTMHTGAECAGRIEGMHQAQKLGIEVQKQWLATLDGHTRDSHRTLDGQIRDVDKPFDSEFGKIRFPGDATAAPGDVWNCRCTLIYVYPKYPDSMTQRRDNITGEVIEDMTYREWERMKREEMPEQDEGIPGFTVVDGNDISMTWERRPDEFDFEINDVINAQGFDGVPRVVDDDEFERAVRESGFIAQRTYSAPDKATLDAYRDQLYNGVWYVDCGTGGAQYGQGMYCAADFNGELTDGIRAEMEHYQRQGQIRCDEKAKELAYQNAWESTISGATEIEKAFIMDEYFHTASLEQRRMLRRISNEDVDAWMEKFNPIAEKAEAAAEAAHGISYVETITLDPSAKIVTYKELDKMRTYGGLETRLAQEMELSTSDRETILQWIEDEADVSDLPSNLREKGELLEHKAEELMNMNPGSLAAAFGYDAINAEGHGQSGSYTVILNRTKAIFRRPQ